MPKALMPSRGQQNLEREENPRGRLKGDQVKYLWG
jgi:hypothetical protein